MVKILNNEIKGRVWAFVLYPESCLDYCDMVKTLNNLGVAMAISPLHIPAKNPKQDNELKEHYHVLMYFDGQKKQSQLRKLTDMSSSSYNRQYFVWDKLVDRFEKRKSKDFAPYPYFLKVNSISNYFRYLIHLDSPDKQQFNDYKIASFVIDDEQKYNHIVLLNGFNPRDYLNNTQDNADLQLLKLVKENKFESINELIQYLAYAKNLTLLNYCKKNMGWLRCFLLADLCFYNRKENTDRK